MNVRTLESRIGGSVVQRGDDQYESVRRAMVWNALKPSRHPDVIVHVADDADVVAAVRFAREHQLRVAVRGGGHSWCGAALRAGGMLIDLSRLNKVSLDAAARIAVAQPVVRNRDLARQLGAHGLAFPLGHCSTVPLSGYVLSGGFGWNAGAWGPACFSVRAIEVVTADGELRTADGENDADLLWAARGGGPGFFGVVTRFQLQLYPLPRAITRNRYIYPLERLTDVVEWMGSMGPQLPAAVELVLALGAAPMEVAQRCAHRNGMACSVRATAFVDTPDQARTALAALEESTLVRACLWKETDQPTPFDELFSDMDRLFPEHHRYLADALWSNAAPAEVIDTLREHIGAAPSAKSLVLCIVPPPSPPDAPPPPAAAFSMVGRVFILCYAIWDSAQDDAANRAWHRRAIELLERFASGHYVGEADIAGIPSRTMRSFAPANWERLQRLRRQYDPDGLFHGFFE